MAVTVIAAALPLLPGLVFWPTTVKPSIMVPRVIESLTATPWMSLHRMRER